MSNNHGEKKLEVKTKLWDVIEGTKYLPQALTEMIPHFKFKAHDYSPPGTEKIIGMSLLQVILWILKAIREKNFQAFRKGIKKFFEQMEIVADVYGLQIATEITQITLVYVLNARTDIDEEELSKQLPEGGEIMETVAKKFLKKEKKKKRWKQ